MQNIYLGEYDGHSGVGIQALVQASDAVARRDGALADRRRHRSAIGNMTPTFGEAITSNPAAVEAARTAVGELRQTLESQVLPLAAQ